ncbi:hypothetical protein [Roseibium algae]|uniref:hypothetical protein n=1 Tax=Roseibium algae TaxID=3123038 RepID=UPI0030ECD204
MSPYEIAKTDLMEAWSILHHGFKDLGLTLERGSDFDLIDARSLAAGAPLLEGHFSPSLNTYTPAQAFWLSLSDANGNCVGRIAARLDDLGGMCLTDFWRKYFYRCYPRADGTQVSLADSQPRLGQAIRGRVVYMGGCWIHEDWRSQKLGGMITQMVQIDALEEWSPNFLYGWVQGSNFRNGFWRDCGFSRCHFEGVRWSGGLPATLDPNLIFVGNSGHDACDLAERVVEQRRVQSSSRTGDDTRISS